LGAPVIVTHEEGPPPGALVVPGAPVVGAPVLPEALTGDVGFVATGVDALPLPPEQDVAKAGGALAQAQTALADANTAPAELAPHAESTQGAAVA
jgi:hypothetical protein